MRRKIVLLLLLSLVLQSNAFAYQRVQGYTNRNTGSYVQPHYRTKPNKVKIDNWSAKGNTNLFTVKKGYKSWW